MRCKINILFIFLIFIFSLFYSDQGNGQTTTTLKIGELIRKQKREVVFKAAWGAGPGQLGRDDGQEAESTGPMSFAVDNSGRLFVLDQVNKRIQVYNSSGKYSKAIPIPTSFFSDIDIEQSGNLFLLDKDISKSIVLIDDTGKELKRLRLADLGISETGGVGGIYSRKNGLWVENDGISIRICDASGKPEKKRPRVKGVPAGDDNYFLEARKLGDITVSVIINTMHRVVNNYDLYYQIPVLYFTVQEADKNGNLYIGVQLFEEGDGPGGRKGPPFSIEDNHEVIVVTDDKGREKRRIYMPVSRTGLSINRSVRIAPQGAIYQLVLEDNEAVMWRYMP